MAEYTIEYNIKIVNGIKNKIIWHSTQYHVIRRNYCQLNMFVNVFE